MEKCDLLIKNAVVMTDYETVEYGMDIAVSDGRITAVAKSGAREFCAEKTISGEEKLFMPGLIDSHMHTGQQLLKGLVLDAKPIIWTRVMLPFESTLTPEKMKLSAQAAALEMIKSGTTAFIDAGSYYMDAAAEVYEKSGLRGCLSYSTMDEDGLPESIAMDAAQAVTETDRLYDGWNGKGNLKVYYSLRALNSCSHELTELAAGHARERGAMLQAHMNEYQGEVDGIIKRENMRPYEFLEKMGVLSDRFLGAHSLILSETEKELIKKRGVKLCHCPFSNCGKAVPDTPDLAERGIIPGFGTDGAAHGGLSLWNEMRIFRSLMNIYHGVPNRNPKVMPAELLFRMLWEGGAAAVDEAGQCGKIAEGCKADFVSIYLDAGRLIPSGNLLHTMFECAESGDVRDMVVGGKVLMENREVQTLDEEKIRFEMKEYMKRM
ncbi:amidohydrolase [Schaedlerella arabinosiphila]|uniref:Amidohydrolase n=1 Tax=Schaedlerella arabinosiphila TaxID=2044587 RepID=A0A426DN22_9FIRM|nr:amidohydrolase family protein [Schaedlerella arabinosiphila]RRK34182.1 amidohydrolase [Schaedlerella arabinosiphila]